MKKHNNALILSIICLFLFVCCAGNAMADDGAAIFQTLAEKTGGFAQGFRRVAMVLGAFGIVMFTFMAICGKINFKHLGYIVICLSDASAYELPEVVVVGHAHGGSGGAIFDTLAEKTGGFAQKFRRLAMVMGAFGIVMFTFMAICGKINFKHLGYIVICLFFLAGTASLISYISDSHELPTTFSISKDTYQRASNI